MADYHIGIDQKTLDWLIKTTFLRELSYTVGGNVSWFSYYEKQYEASSEN